MSLIGSLLESELAPPTIRKEKTGLQPGTYIPISYAVAANRSRLWMNPGFWDLHNHRQLRTYVHT